MSHLVRDSYRVDRVPAYKDGEYFYLEPVLEQLHYWGVNTNNHHLLMAEHVIRELLKRLDATGEGS